MTHLLKPTLKPVLSNERRIAELEQRCRFAEHNIATLAKALSGDLETILGRVEALEQRIEQHLSHQEAEDFGAAQARQTIQAFEDELQRQLATMRLIDPSVTRETLLERVAKGLKA